MSDIRDNNAALAEISIVKSTDLMENLKNQNDLIATYNHVQDASDRALAVKSVLERTPVFGVTQTFGTTMDRQLQRIGVIDIDSDDVAGVESLGYTLSPKDYLSTRISGCESFISNALSQAGRILTELGEGVRERYVLLTESNRSLQRRLDKLQIALDKAPPMKRGTHQVPVTVNPTLFMVNGKIVNDWGVQFEKVDKTVKALVSNYYRNNQESITGLLSYFGGFANLEEDAARQRLLSLPSTIEPYVFKECMFPNREETDAVVKARNSVELLGGRVFVNRILNKRPANLKSEAEVLAWVEQFVSREGVAFVRLPKPELTDRPEIESFSTVEIKAGIKLTSRILKDAEFIFSEGDRYSPLGEDYMDQVKAIMETTWSEEFKQTVVRCFEKIGMKYNQEMLENRTEVVQYLTLLINGYITLAYASIEAQ